MPSCFARAGRRTIPNVRPTLAAVGLLLAAGAFSTASVLAEPVRVTVRFQPPTSWADLADAAERAVVSIQAVTIESVAPGVRSKNGEGGGQDPFEFFFGDRGKPGTDAEPEAPGAGEQAPSPPINAPKPPQLERSDSGGSGFVISKDGLVVTNFHVIDGATRLTVHLGDRDYPATVRGTDRATDLALLEIHAGVELPYFELADSDAARVGDWVMVIGNPLNLDKTVTAGLISAKGRSIGISDVSFESFIQTDAAINFGNSGGPLIDVTGRVVGIATAINYGAENIGFAVPANTLREILPQLRDRGWVSRGAIGAVVRNLDAAQAPAFGVAGGGAVLVASVEKGAPAERSGIVHGDVLLEADGRKLETTHDLIDYVSAKGPGATVTLAVLRDGKAIEKQVTLKERGGAEPPPAPASPAGAAWPGLELERWDAPGEADSEAHELAGVRVAKVELESAWYEQGVRSGHVVSEINGRPVANEAELRQALAGAKPGSYVRLYVWRIGRGGRTSPFFAVTQVP